MPRFALLMLLLTALACAQAQAPACRVYKTFSQGVSNSGVLLSTIAVPDAFPVGSAKILGLALGHPTPATLELSLMHRASADAPATTTVPLKAQADGAYAPQAPLGAEGATGQWVLQVTDPQPGADTRLISLASWALLLCPSGAPVVANDGPKSLPGVAVSISGSGVSVNITNSTAAAGKGDGAPGDLRVATMEGHAQNLLTLLFPGAAAAKPDGVSPLGLVTAVKAAGRRAADTQITDAFAFAANQSEVYKDFVNKKLSDAVGGVNAASGLAVGLMTNKGGLFKLHGTSLTQFLTNLKGMLAADAQGKIASALNLAAQLGSLSGSVGSDLKSTTGLLHQLVVAKLAGVARLFTTTEGIAKTHIDNAVAGKVALLDALLDKVIAGLSVAQASKLTGPVVDVKLQLDAAKLKALRGALNVLAAAVKATPTPSQFVVSKVAAFGSGVTDILKQTRVAELLDGDDDNNGGSAGAWAPRHALLAPLMQKVERAQQLLDQADKGPDAANKYAANKDAGAANKDAGAAKDGGNGNNDGAEDGGNDSGNKGN